MREVLVNKLMINYEDNPKYDKLTLTKIKYGAECFYTFFTKLIVILLISYFLNIINYVGLFILFYTPLRIYGFGFHAPKNIWCWIISSFSMLLLPFIASKISFSTIETIIIQIIISLLLIWFCPADTKKRPLINRKKAKVNKLIVAIILLFYIIIIAINNNYINNFILMASAWQLVCCSPVLYFLFNQPYNNYKKYNY